jgi:hypothetical protein
MSSSQRTPTTEQPVVRQSPAPARWPQKVAVTKTGVMALNEYLRCVALVLGIIIMAAVIVLGVRVAVVAGQVRDSLDETFGTSEGSSGGAATTMDGNGDVCWDPGGGVVCVPAEDYEP